MEVTDFPGVGVELDAFDALPFDGIAVLIGTGHGEGEFDGIAIKEAVVFDSPMGMGKSSKKVFHHGLDFREAIKGAELGGVVSGVRLEAGPDILEGASIGEQDVVFRKLDGVLHKV